ncbi:hypothetical protein [Natronocalculus amylovorans]|uniref:DUF4209 domain-containing protein n=1 Tax=Natronocalculus amylovorans TaxID=2917812 RepID=A0AAE3G246_9EURY|nr:hypothetical protein [Natronocalculus amylovorans]MCL9818344.1 hypothetical protein [Natronocalculus amylovorans]
MRLAEELQSLLENGSENSRFDIELSSSIRELNNDWGRSPKQLREEIQECDFEHPLIEFLVGLSRWIENDDYPNGAKLAKKNLRDAIDLAISEGWDSLLPTLMVERIALLSDLNHTEELKAEIYFGLLFLNEKKKENSLPVGHSFDILEEIEQNIETISGTTAIDILSQYIEKQAEKAGEAGNYQTCRKLWRINLRIRDDEGIDKGIPRTAIIKSYADEIIELKSTNKNSLRANCAKEAIVECDAWIGEEQRVTWEHDFIDGNKKSIEQMGEIVHEPSEEEIEELDQELEDFIESFRKHRKRRHAIFALKWLLNHDMFVPDIEQAQKIAEDGIMNHVQRRTITEAGESYSQEDGTTEFPPSYGAMIQFVQNIRQAIYYRLQNRGLISQGDLFVLINERKVLSTDTHAYLTDFVIHLFEHNHSAAVHLGMTQLEAVIRELAAENGKSILSRDGETGGLGRRSFGSLLYQIEGEVDESWIAYLRYRYVDLGGQNVRNKIAHGYLPYRHAAWGMSIIILFDILQNFIEFERAYD